MAKKKESTAAGAGETVELKDKQTGFYDPVTGFKIVHDQRASLGETVGKKTNKALLSGTLLIVGAERPQGLQGAPKTGTAEQDEAPAKTAAPKAKAEATEEK